MNNFDVITALLLMAGLACLPASAQHTVFRCANPSGQVAYQAAPCDQDTAGASQTLVQLPANPPPVKWVPPPKPVLPAAPRVAVITLYYDTTNEPMEYPTVKMEALIRSALGAWAAGCKVDLRYGGRAPYRAGGNAERVSLRWLPEYLRARHPADDGFGLAGTGSMAAGIALSTRFAQPALLSTLVHELGHVLGLPHNHADPKSIMSYLQDEASRRTAQPSASDYLACNLSMKKYFGIDFVPPIDTALQPTAREMTDREALDKKRELAP